MYMCCALLVFLLGAQVEIRELKLLSRRFNYQIRMPQYLTYAASVLSLMVLAGDVFRCHSLLWWLTAAFVYMLLYAIVEWLLAVFSPRRLAVAGMVRLLVVIVAAVGIYRQGMWCLAPFLFAGLYFRNSPFGLVHGKPFFLAYYFHRYPKATSDSKAVMEKSVHDRLDVTQYGIRPDTGKDVLEPVQELIDRVGREGGGCIFFPKGRYLFNRSGDGRFLQINHSNVTIEGETDADGQLLTELVNCGHTVNGRCNPWLSPFFITTGEALQPSNQFWGLDFKKPSHLRMESSSLSDPGSDGALLTPPFATSVIADAKSGNTILKVADSRAVGKYVLLGLYNTSADGSLIKEILGVEELRPEWTNAMRAGVEEAPSFQWLVEVKRVVDEHTIELCSPLLRDCQMRYAPALFNVELLEDIHIRNVQISSQWNGLFHHHGIPLYYSVHKAQEMDYGWNAINMKRAVHSSIEHVVIRNFSNPLYVQDSLDVCAEHIAVKGYDGHQGIKVYCHTCNCTFEHIDFYCHFADMMGGEGNAYGNVFRDINYLNPVFNPVDFDFHGFSEGPMSPPAYNVFERVRGFRCIKGAGATFMQPACGVGNVWRNITFEGGRRGDPLFSALSYRVKSGLEKYVTAIGFTLVMMMKRKNHSAGFAKQTFMEKLRSIDQMSIPRSQHAQFFPGCQVE